MGTVPDCSVSFLEQLRIVIYEGCLDDRVILRLAYGGSM